MTKAEELSKIATFGTDKAANRAMIKLRKINSTYHWCLDWDLLVICDTDLEYQCCTCKNK